MANFTPEELEEILQQFFDVTGKRQYIGARYVPIFGRKDEASIEWDNSAPYEPLTIVLYQGNSYTSRTYVPTGVEITDTHYWAQTGNYNAQVEQYRQAVEGYRQEVLSYVDDIETVKTDLTEYIDSNENMCIYSYVGAPASYLVKCGGVWILCDCGTSADADKLDAFLTEKLGTDKLDCVIISHYDSDHYMGFNVAAKYCDANTQTFVEMMPSPNASFYTAYNSARLYVENICSEYNLTLPSVPPEDFTTEIGDVSITFMNTNIENRSAYENAPSTSISGSTGEGGNNFSLISRIEFNESSFVYCGDIEVVAQRLYAGKMEHASCFNNPHHLWGNPWGYYDFYKALGFDSQIVTNMTQGAYDTNYDFIGRNPAQTVHVPASYGYLRKLLLSNCLAKVPIINGFDSDFEIQIHKGVVIPIATSNFYRYINECTAAWESYGDVNYEACLLRVDYNYNDSHWPCSKITFNELLKNLATITTRPVIEVRLKDTVKNYYTWYSDIEDYLTATPYDVYYGAAFIDGAQKLTFDWSFLNHNAMLDKLSFSYLNNTIIPTPRLNTRPSEFYFTTPVDKGGNISEVMGAILFRNMMRSNFISLQFNTELNNGLVLTKSTTNANNSIGDELMAIQNHSALYANNSASLIGKYYISSSGVWDYTWRRLSDGAEDTTGYDTIKLVKVKWWN